MTRKPSKGTRTRRVWEIGDEITRRMGRPASRKEVIEIALSEGLNANTASTQYWNWKTAKFPELSREGSETVRPAASNVPPSRETPSAPKDWAWLLKNGFFYGADWKLSDSGELSLDREAPAENGVYVFVFHDEVVYVGVTMRPLRKRMDDYRRGHVGQRTSARIRGLIVDALQRGAVIRVLFATPGEMEWNGLPVDIASGLEKGLISSLKPGWNMQGL